MFLRDALKKNFDATLECNYKGTFGVLLQREEGEDFS
jgi:hypothetical protein